MPALNQRNRLTCVKRSLGKYLLNVRARWRSQVPLAWSGEKRGRGKREADAKLSTSSKSLQREKVKLLKWLLNKHNNKKNASQEDSQNNEQKSIWCSQHVKTDMFFIYLYPAI